MYKANCLPIYISKVLKAFFRIIDLNFPYSSFTVFRVLLISTIRFQARTQGGAGHGGRLTSPSPELDIFPFFACK